MTDCPECTRLRNIIASARYCMEQDLESGVRACLDGNGLDDGIAEDMKSDLDRARDRIAALEAAIAYETQPPAPDEHCPACWAYHVDGPRACVSVDGATSARARREARSQLADASERRANLRALLRGEVSR